VSEIIDIRGRDFIKNRIDPQDDSPLSQLKRTYREVFLIYYDRKSGDISISDQGGFIISIDDSRTIIDGLENFCNLYSQSNIDDHNDKVREADQRQSERVESSHPKKKKLERDGYIYILKSDYGYKIGKSLNYAERLSYLDLQLPFKVEKWLVMKVKAYSQAEKSTHELMEYTRINGEWFSLNRLEINSIIGHLETKFSGEIIFSAHKSKENATR